MVRLITPVLLITFLLGGCVTVTVRNPYPGQPLPELVSAPDTVTVSLLHVYGSQGRLVANNVYRIRSVFVRPIDVKITNLSKYRWLELRRGLLISANARAVCVLETEGRYPYYRCRVPPRYLPVYRHDYDRRYY